MCVFLTLGLMCSSYVKHPGSVRWTEAPRLPEGGHLFTDLSALPAPLASSEMSSLVTFGASSSGTGGKTDGPGPGVLLGQGKESIGG